MDLYQLKGHIFTSVFTAILTSMELAQRQVIVSLRALLVIRTLKRQGT
jgi:hypothetical protein